MMKFSFVFQVVFISSDKETNFFFTIYDCKLAV